MSSPPVSVIVPTYNAAGFLPRTIESVLQQGWRDYELIVIDNASTDATPAVLQNIRDPRVRCFRNATNIGMVNNINKGVELATGRLGIVLCADDHWHPDFLQRSLELQRSSPGLCFTNSVVVRDGIESPHRNVHSRRARISAPRLIRHLQGIPLSSLMFPLRGDASRFDPRLPFNCDLEFVLRSMIRDGQSLTMLDWPGVYVALHDANETLRYDIRRENMKLLDIVSGYTSSAWLRLLLAAKKGRLQLG